MYSADFELEYPSAADASIVERSVRVEAGDISGDRTQATVSRDGATVTVRVEAEDRTALRAGVNTWLTLVEVAESTGIAARQSR